jgi:hypothetical protein
MFLTFLRCFSLNCELYCIKNAYLVKQNITKHILQYYECFRSFHLRFRFDFDSSSIWVRFRFRFDLIRFRFGSISVRFRFRFRFGSIWVSVSENFDFFFGFCSVSVSDNFEFFSEEWLFSNNRSNFGHNDRDQSWSA